MRHTVPVFAGAVSKVALEFTAELRCNFVSDMDGCFTYPDTRFQQHVSSFGKTYFLMY